VIGRRRVAVFTTRFLPYSETFIHDELRAHQRYRADVFCTRHLVDSHAAFPHPTVLAGGRLYAWTRHASAFDRRLASGGYGLIHAHFGGGGVYALPFARRHGLPLVVTFHGYDVPLLASGERLYPKYWPYALLAPAMLRHLTLGLCASVELLEMLRELGVPSARLRLHPIGIDVDRFAARAWGPDDGAEPPPPPPPPGAAAGEPLVAMVGRFVPKKGLVYGLRAFAGVRRLRGTGAGRLVVVGDGVLRPRLEQAARDEGIADLVSFPGALPHAEVARILCRADVLMAPSVTTANGDRESGTLVVKEASAAGAIPIATWHGGHAEIVEDGRTGFLVPERNVAALAERLDQLLGDLRLRRRMALAGRAKMRAEYDNRLRVAALEAAYDTVWRAPL
jgi:colanic acid/amylovoran biosynthesis glycosyltransferase